jgi:hypothetical protein
MYRLFTGDFFDPFHCEGAQMFLFCSYMFNAAYFSSKQAAPKLSGALDQAVVGLPERDQGDQFE